MILSRCTIESFFTYLSFRNRRYSHFLTSYHDHTLKIEDITTIRHHYNNDNIEYLIGNTLIPIYYIHHP